MGTTDLIKGFVSTRTGKKFDAKLVLDDNKETRFEFAQQTAKGGNEMAIERKKPN